MKLLKKQPSVHDILLKAARRQLRFGGFSCLNLSHAGFGAHWKTAQDAKDFYRFYFSPSEKDSAAVGRIVGSAAWWPEVKGKLEREPRVLALLLAAEIAKDIS